MLMVLVLLLFVVVVCYVDGVVVDDLGVVVIVVNDVVDFVIVVDNVVVVDISHWKIVGRNYYRVGLSLFVYYRGYPWY